MMNHNLLFDVEECSKSALVKKSILNYYINNGNATLVELAKEFDLSIPTITKLINELKQDKFIINCGKIESSRGRSPHVFGLNPNSGYFLGVDFNRVGINIGVINFKGEMINLSENIPFKIENTVESLNQLCDLILNYIVSLSIEREKILNINLNISGRVNPHTGYSYSIFYFEKEHPLTETLSEKLGFNVTIDNDTRAMTYGEYMRGNVNNEKNILFVNAGWGIGIGIIIDGKLYNGKSGFSGEFGHVSTFDNEIMCHCGKKGCLETEASGVAAHRILMDRCRNGENSILSKFINQGDQITINDIIQAVNKDDMLSIEIIEEVGNKLGKSIAGLINIFNPDLVIIGGILSQTGDYLMLPIKSAIRKHSLNLVNNDSQIVLSKLKEKAGVIGACMMSRSRVLDIC